MSEEQLAECAEQVAGAMGDAAEPFLKQLGPGEQTRVLFLASAGLAAAACCAGGLSLDAARANVAAIFDQVFAEIFEP